LLPFDIRYNIPENMDRYQIRDIARSFLQDNDFELGDFDCVVTRQTDFPILSYLEREKGPRGAGKLIRQDKIPNIRWQARFRKNLPIDQPQTRYDVWISPNGQVTGFSRTLPDTLTLPSLEEQQALGKAVDYLKNRFAADLDTYDLKQSEQRRKSNRTDYLFVWEKQPDFADGTLRLTTLVQGDQIGVVQFSYELPEQVQLSFSSLITQTTFLYLVQFIAITLLFIFALILFLKKYHEGEVSVSLGRNIFVIFFLLGLFRSINELSTAGVGIGIGNLSPRNIQIIVFIFEVLLQNVFFGVFLLTSWAVGEAHARAIWPEKLKSIDGLLNRKFFTLSSGISLLRGGSIGFAVAAFYLLMMRWLTGEGSEIHVLRISFSDIYQYFVPAVSVILSAIMTVMLCEIVFRFFIINTAFQRWRKKWIALIVSVFVWPFGYFLISDFPTFTSIPISILLAVASGLFLGWLYLKYDLLTVIATSAAAHISLNAVPLLSSTAGWHRISLYILVGVLLIPAAQIVISFWKRQTFEFSGLTMPRHIKRISERERMQKELEIARSVQLGLLPTTNPVIPGFDIAGICLPAKEVGGDYFDYINLGPDKLGIAIGDVSGKGVPAAIYMTLTKGILQSHADETISPKIVLGKVNRLLYRNIEKNSFVSMFYAVLDHKKLRLTFARAGHNPGILLSQDTRRTEFLNTDGIALGLEYGEIFERTLKENTIQIRRGDLLVFYTDGFTEAMNLHQQEYGEDRLVDLIINNRSGGAEDIITLLLSEIKAYIGEAEQHDDMTIVVVKAL
jgi:membrane protease YdiL (CAAX protease family)